MAADMERALGVLKDTEMNISVEALGFRDPYGCAYMLQENSVGARVVAEAAR